MELPWKELFAFFKQTYIHIQLEPRRVAVRLLGGKGFMIAPFKKATFVEM
jgi:hypothetical protein